MKSVKRQKSEGTQEFFDKKRNTNAAFTFNKAPLNKKEAVKSFESAGPAKKRSTFVSKLYQDERQIDEMKVLQGSDFDSDDAEIEEHSKKREMKSSAKDKT